MIKYVHCFLIIGILEILIIGCQPSVNVIPVKPASENREDVSFQEDYRYIAELVSANGGDEVLLDLADDIQYRFLKNRVLSVQTKTQNSPGLLNRIEDLRAKHLSATRDLLPRRLVEGDGHVIMRTEIGKDGTLLASVYSSTLQNSEYMYLDVMGWDENKNFLTPYAFNETLGGQSLKVTAKGSIYINRHTPQQIFVDSLMLYATYEHDFVVSYTNKSYNTEHIVYPRNLRLDAPVEYDKGFESYGRVLFCLGCRESDCDYSLDFFSNHFFSGDLRIPFKGRIDFGHPIISITGEDGVRKPDPEVSYIDSDEQEHFIRNINLSLALQEGGISKKIKPEDTSFFWESPGTRVSDGITTNSVLEWDLFAPNGENWINFESSLFRNSVKVSFFVEIDLPLLSVAGTPVTGCVFLVPEDHFQDTPFEYESGIIRSGLISNSIYTLEVVGQNQSDGNWQSLDNATRYTWTIDSDPPVSKLYNTPPAFPLVSTSGPYAIAVGGEGVVKYSYKLDIVRDDAAKMFGSWSDPVDISQPVCGNPELAMGGEAAPPAPAQILYSLQVRGIDQAGNWETVPQEFTWLFRPGEPAQVQAQLMNLPACFSAELHPEITVGGTNVTGYMYQLDDHDPATVTTLLGPFDAGVPIRLDLPVTAQTRMYTLSVTGIDNNQVPAALQTAYLPATTYSWTVDQTPPQAELYFPVSSDNKTSSGELDIQIGGNNLVSYSYLLDGVAYQERPVDDLLCLVGLKEGLHTIQVRGKNRAGVWSADGVSYTWEIDPTVSNAVLTGLPRRYTNRDNIKIAVGGVLRAYSFRLTTPGTLQPDFGDAQPLENPLLMPVFMFIWNCMSGDTEIRMAGGASKAIRGITEAEYVDGRNFNLSPGGTAMELPVLAVSTGFEPSAMYRVVDSSGNSILVTRAHPFILEDFSTRRAEQLRPGHRVITQSGVSEIVRVETETYKGPIFNLTLGTREEKRGVGNAMYANGFLIGDNTMQSLPAGL